MSKRYFWVNSNNEHEFRVLRIYTEGQVHLDEFTRMLDRIGEAYLPWAQASEWLNTTQETHDDDDPYESPRFRRLMKSLRVPGPFEREVLAAVLIASEEFRARGGLVDAVRAHPVSPSNALILDRCTLSSPGQIDLLGIGKALEVVANFINGCLDRPANRRKVEAETDEIKERTRKSAAERRTAELDNVAKELDILERLERKAERLGYPKEERRQLFDGYLKLALPPLREQVDSGLIQGADLVSLVNAGQDDAVSRRESRRRNVLENPDQGL